MQRHIQEIVRFRVKPESLQGYEAVIQNRNAVIKEMAGFIRGGTFQSPIDPEIFIDSIEWNSLEEAQSAAQAAMQMPEMQPFMASIAQIEFFEHFEIYSEF